MAHPMRIILRLDGIAVEVKTAKHAIPCPDLDAATAFYTNRPSLRLAEFESKNG